MWDDLVRALCLMLVFEGMLPFLYPSRWREMVSMLALVSDKSLRIMGLVSMVIGVIILYLAR